MSSGWLGLRHKTFNRKTVLQTERVGIGKSGHLVGRGGLMEYAVQLHYGKCRIQGFWSLTLTKDWKSGYLNLYYSDLNFFFLVSLQTLWRFNTKITGVLL